MQNNYLPIRTAIEQVIGSYPAKSTIRRWVGPGVRGKRLACVMVGGRRMATVNDVREFISDRAVDVRGEVPSDVRRELNALLGIA
jgi:hypothetical protein